MARQGRLTLDRYGPSMPVTGPAVQKPPFYYRNMEMMFVSYRTDAEAALDWLPDALELDEPATATVILAHYHFSTFGPYHEAMLAIRARWQGQVVNYYPALFTDQEAPLIGGREIWGFAKKLAHVALVHESEAILGTVERPRGNRLLTAVMRAVDNVRPEEFALTPSVSLKVIPDATDAPEPALAQLIGSELRMQPLVGSDGIAEIWSGPGSLCFDTPSAVDPWHRIAVREVVSCVYGSFNAVLTHGRILKQYR